MFSGEGDTKLTEGMELSSFGTVLITHSMFTPGFDGGVGLLALLLGGLGLRELSLDPWSFWALGDPLLGIRGGEEHSCGHSVGGEMRGTSSSASSSSKVVVERSARGRFLVGDMIRMESRV